MIIVHLLKIRKPAVKKRDKITRIKHKMSLLWKHAFFKERIAIKACSIKCQKFKIKIPKEIDTIKRESHVPILKSKVDN